MRQKTNGRLPPELPSRVFTLALDQLRPGDIILTRSPKDLISNLIMIASWSDFSHAILVVALPNAVESSDYGVVRFRLDRFAVADPANILVRRPKIPLTPAAEKELIRFADRQADKEYAETDVLSALFSWVPKFEEGRFFCSQFVAESYNAAGAKLLSKAASAAKITPKMIADSPLLKSVEGVLIERSPDDLPIIPAMLDSTNATSLNERLIELKQRIVASISQEFDEYGYPVFSFNEALLAIVDASTKDLSCAAQMDHLLVQEMMAESFADLPRRTIPASSADFFIDVRVRKAILVKMLTDAQSKQMLLFLKEQLNIADNTLSERRDDIQKVRIIYVATGLESYRLYLCALWETYIFHQRMRDSVNGAITHLQDHLKVAQ